MVADGSPAEVFSDPVCGRTYGVDLVAETSRRGTLMIDATHLKAHRTAASLLKKGLFPDVSGAPKAA